MSMGSEVMVYTVLPSWEMVAVAVTPVCALLP